MTRPNTITIVSFLAFILAGSASLLVYKYLKQQASGQKQGVVAVAAATDIPIGTKLDASHIKLTTWPKEALSNGYHNDDKALPGRIAVRQISAGDIITESKLMPLNGAQSGGIMTYIVPHGHRAVTVAVNEVAGVAGFITPNSRVDVVLTTPRPGSADKEDNISKIILQNVSVLASGQVTEQKEGKPVVVPTVTLDLVPDDAEKLIVGAKKGSLQLLLRNVIDVAVANTTGATISKALNITPQILPTTSTRRIIAKRKAAAPPPVQTRLSVEVIKGGNKSVKEFPTDI